MTMHTQAMTIRINEEPKPYVPREGDVLEKGRRRVVVVWADSVHAKVEHYTQSRLTGAWYRRGWDYGCTPMLSLMATRDGWTVIRTAPESAKP